MNAYLDANIVIKACLGNEERSLSILNDIAKGKIEAVSSALVMDEIMWAILKNNQAEFMDAIISNLYKLKHLEIKAVDADLPLIALDFIKKCNLKPRDAMHCAFMKKHGIETIISDDRDFDKVKEFKRIF